MSNNREKRIYQENVHLFIALQRNGSSSNKKCFRHVIKEEELDLQIVEAKCRAMGGEWRIHKTVNIRNVEKARIWLLKHLIDNPKNASFVDSCWKTALLQRECRATNYFMFDVDTKEKSHIRIISILFENIEKSYRPVVHMVIESPKGYHIITDPFDTRKICELEYVTLIRDGYYYVKTVKGEKE